MSQQRTSARLAIIVVIFNMRRETRRTLYSLSTDYQRNVSTTDYDVIVVENGSSQPMTPQEVAQFGSNFRYIRIDNASPSPAAAINFAVSQTTAKYVGIMIDGARIASPGVISLGLKTLTAYDRPVVGTLAFHLGPDWQTRSIVQGYNRKVEDELLENIDWYNNGYRLFEISTIAPSSARGRFGKIIDRFLASARSGSKRGWLGTIAEYFHAVKGLAESNLLFLPTALFDELEGFDERFDFPGGGLVNSDFYLRACNLKETTLITLSGEATFHQLHGGAMTSKPNTERINELKRYRDQFRHIRGSTFNPSTRVPMVIGFHKPDNVDDQMEACALQCFVDPASLKTKVLHGIHVGMKRFKGWLRRLFLRVF